MSELKAWPILEGVGTSVICKTCSILLCVLEHPRGPIGLRPALVIGICRIGQVSLINILGLSIYL